MAIQGTADGWQLLSDRFRSLPTVRLRWTAVDGEPHDGTWAEAADMPLIGKRFRDLAATAGKALCPENMNADAVTWYRHLLQASPESVRETGRTPFYVHDERQGEYQFLELPDAQECSANCAALLAARSKVENASGSKTETPVAVHSDDFASVRWFGKSYEFTNLQSACVKVLWRNWEQGTPVVSEAAIQTESDTDTSLRNIFRGHPAWDSMIVPGDTKGRFKLQPPAAG